MQAKTAGFVATTTLVPVLVSFLTAGTALADTPPPPLPPPGVRAPVLTLANTNLQAGRPTPIPAPVPFRIASPATVTPAVPAPPPAPKLLMWDSTQKEQTVLPGAPTAEFFFAVTNVSEEAVVITAITPSCGCTMAKAPPLPWRLAPHSDGRIDISVNLAGKNGRVGKTISVMSTNAPQTLYVFINIPENPAMARARNQQMALADPQAIFKGECASCHVDKAAGKMDKELYTAACGICHDSPTRATMVADLHNLNHPTDYAFWKQIISEGKKGTLMPAFSNTRGGPLSDVQIESLAQLLVKAFPSKPMPLPGTNGTASAIIIQPGASPLPGK